MNAFRQTVGRFCVAAIVVLNIDLPLDQVGPDQAGIRIGDHHRVRIFYDDSTVNPVTHRVRVIHMQHWMDRWVPVTVGTSEMPMTDAWLDLGSHPYRYHYRCEVTLGEPVIVEFDAERRRMSIRRHRDGSVLIAAPYTIDPVPVAGVTLQVTDAQGSSPSITGSDR